MKNKNVAIGIASSVAIGAILGILFAPDKGCNTRDKIIQKGKGLKNNIKDGIESLTSSIENEYEKIVSKTEDIAQEANLAEEKIIGNNKPVIK